MDLKVNVGHKEKGSIPYEALPVFQYLFREMGFDVKHDTKGHRLNLTSAFADKKIIIAAEENTGLRTFRKLHLEKMVLEQIRMFLTVSGADVEVLTSNAKGVREPADLRLTFSLLEVPNISKPLLELAHNSKLHYHKLAEVIQMECQKAGIKFKWIDIARYDNQATVKIEAMYPVVSDDEFWNIYGENFAIIIASGILARFLGRSTLSILALAPVENLVSLLSSANPKDEKGPGKANESREHAPKKEVAENKRSRIKTKEAEVFFDYHLLVDESDLKKAQLLGQLHIKNVGTDTLHNPVICLRSTPSENIKITGQILPPNFAQTKGVLNNEGSKGWRYMNQNWLEEYEEKGEIWICPIQSITIPPRGTETLSNLQISLLSLNQKTVRVEAFVYFSEGGLEFKSNNQISLSLLTKS